MKILTKPPKIIINDSARLELEKSWDMEMEVMIWWVMTKVKVTVQNPTTPPAQTQQPEIIEPEPTPAQPKSQLQQQLNGYWYKLKPQAPTPYRGVRAKNNPTNKPIEKHTTPETWPDVKAKIDLAKKLMQKMYSPWLKRAIEKDATEVETPLKKDLWIADMDEEEAMLTIKSILRDNLYERRVLHKRWRLETNRLSHYRTSPKIFSKKTWLKGKDYSFEILVDMSWSMFEWQYQKAKNAIKWCLSICRMLEGIWDINIKIFWDWSKEFTPEEFQRCTEWFLKTSKRDVLEKRLWVRLLSAKDKKKKKVVYSMDRQEITYYEKMWRSWDSHWRIWSDTMEVWPMMQTIKKMRKKDWEKCIIIMHDWEHWWVRRHLIDDAKKWRDVSFCWYDMLELDWVDYKKEIQNAISDWLHIHSLWILCKDPIYDYGKEHFTYIDNPDQIHGALVKIVDKMVNN